MDWFLYGNGLRHERVKHFIEPLDKLYPQFNCTNVDIAKKIQSFLIMYVEMSKSTSILLK